MENLNVTLVQSNIVGNESETNRRALNDVLCEIKTDGVIVLPETFATGFSADPNLCAETVDGATFRWMKEMAKQKNCAVCGSMIMAIDQKRHNTFVWINPDGTYKLYNKRHVFSMGEESVERGEQAVVIEYKGWKIKPFICYDLRFPVWIRNRYANGVYEYDIALFVANWPESRVNVWTTLLPARAIENVAYTIGVNRTGVDENGVKYNGHSMICDPKGTVLATTKSDSVETLSFCLSKEDLDTFRAKFKVALDWDRFSIS